MKGTATVRKLDGVALLVTDPLRANHTTRQNPPIRDATLYCQNF